MSILGAAVLLTGVIRADPFGVLVAFGAGVVSFLSPCVLPLVPGYVSMVTGLSVAELAGTSGAGARPAPPARPALLRGIGLFVAGFTVVFVALGAAASGLGQLLAGHKQELTQAAGGVTVGLGAILLAGALPARVWVRAGPRLAGAAATILGERRFDARPRAIGAWAPPVMGMAFAFAWTPCIGPVLGAVTALAATRATLAGGVVLLFAYSLGLGVPFVATGLAFGRLTSVLAMVRRRLWMVNVVAGIVLVAFGAVLVADRIGWVAIEMQVLMRHVGLGRFTTS